MARTWRLRDFGDFLDQIKKFARSFQREWRQNEEEQVPARALHLLDEVTAEQHSLLAPVLLPESCKGSEEDEEQSEHLQQPAEDSTPPRLPKEQGSSSNQQGTRRESLGPPQTKQPRGCSRKGIAAECRIRLARKLCG